MTEVEHTSNGEESWLSVWETFQREFPDEAAEVIRMMEGEAMAGLEGLPPEELHQRLKEALEERMRHGAPILTVQQMHSSLGRIASLPEAEHPADNPDTE